MKALSFIQTRIALLVLVFGLGVLVLNAWDNARWTRDLQMRGMRDDAEAQGTLIAGMMQHCFRNKQHRAAELQMSYTSTVPGLEEGVVVDENDVIQFATRQDWIGLKLQDSQMRELLPLCVRIREVMTGNVVKGSRADEVVSAHPFFTHFDSLHRGVVLLQFNGEGLLDLASAEALHVSIVHAFVLLALCTVLWLVMDFVVTGRVRWLLEQACEYGKEGTTTRVLEGDDELSQVSQAFANAVEHVRQKEVQLLEAAEEERRRIGSDLHDDVCQRITAAQLKSGVLYSALRREEHPQAELAGSVADELAKTTRVARRFARGLAPMLVERGRLVESLREMTSAISESFSVPCECQCRLDGQPLALWVETHVFRIMQELMTNAVKHAQPSRVCGLVEVDRMRLNLMVENDGQAFEQDSVAHGLGLDLVRQRVRALGGVFSIASGEGGQGCRATCSVALNEQHFSDVEGSGT